MTARSVLEELPSSCLGLSMRHTEGSEKLVVSLCFSSAHHYTADKTHHFFGYPLLFIHSFGFITVPTLTHSLVNSGSHSVTWNLVSGGLEHRIFEIFELENPIASPHSYETTSGSVEVVNL